MPSNIKKAKAKYKDQTLLKIKNEEWAQKVLKKPF